MAQATFDQFLNEATHKDQEAHATLEGDAFYGLYTSWCYVSHTTPEPEQVFCEAMRQCIDTRHGRQPSHNPRQAEPRQRPLVSRNCWIEDA